ncbi:MAG: peptidase [Sphingomonadales bacterium]|nr:peptidase [Sphingomonadales bacterium]
MIKIKLLSRGLWLAALMATGANGQIVSPAPIMHGVIGQLRSIDGIVGQLPEAAADTLANARLSRIATLVRGYPANIALDQNGFPARAGELLIDDPDDALLSSAERQGYRLIERGNVLGVRYARLATLPGQSLAAAIRAVRKLGAHSVTADQLHDKTGIVEGTVTAKRVGGVGGGGSAIGIIDGGVADRVTAQRGFASGAPVPTNHGSAVASLISGQGKVRGVLPSARLYVADVYGTDPAGGSASAIARAIGWLVGEGVPVLTISLVGPPNSILARVIAAAQQRGTIIVAAVGNDGPASPPGFPASYPGVVAVTGIDGRDRVLIEAGRALHLDYAAPGADMLAANLNGAPVAVRGTSFAAPLVAGTIAAAYPSPDPAKRKAALASVDAGARKMGSRYGRGIVCGKCRNPTK